MSKRIKELENIIKDLRKEEEGVIQYTKEQIDTICNKNELFCGCVFRLEDIMKMIQLLISSGDNTITVPYHLYYKEDLM
mgnify:CR=1 FL=1